MIDLKGFVAIVCFRSGEKMERWVLKDYGKKKKKECVREYIIRTQVYERDPKNNNNNIVTRPDVRFWVDGVVCCSHGLYFSNLGCGSTFVNLS